MTLHCITVFITDDFNNSNYFIQEQMVVVHVFTLERTST